MGLAERLAVLTASCPKAYAIPYTRVMELIDEAERSIRQSMTQNSKILSLLRRGVTITNLNLIVNYKVRSPTKRISELRAAGHDIVGEWRVCPLDGSEYIEYRLREKKEE